MSSSSEKLELQLIEEDFDRTIKTIGDVSRLLNSASFESPEERTLQIEAFYEKNISNNKAIISAIDLDYSDVDATSFDQDYNECKNVFFLDDSGRLNQKFVDLLNKYGINQQEFYNLVQKEFRLAYNLVFDNEGHVRDYIKKHIPDELLDEEELPTQLLGAALQVTSTDFSNKMGTTHEEAFSPFFGTFFNAQILNAVLNEKQEVLFKFSKPKNAHSIEIKHDIHPIPSNLNQKQSNASKWVNRLIKGAFATAFTIGTSLVGAGIGFVVGGPIGAAIGASIGASVGVAVAGGTWGISSLWNRRSGKKQHQDYILMESVEDIDDEFRGSFQNLSRLGSRVDQQDTKPLNIGAGTDGKLGRRIRHSSIADTHHNEGDDFSDEDGYSSSLELK